MSAKLYISRMSLYMLSELEEIVETAIYTSEIKDSPPVSLLIVGPSGSAKSALIKQYQGDNIYHCDSFSSQGLWDMVQSDQKGLIRFMAVPDLNPTLSRRSSVVQSTIANLLTLTYDGSVRINDGRREKTSNHTPVGLLSAVTPEIYRTNAKRWLFLGLRRRIIPLFFDYSYTTVAALQDLVSKGKIHGALDGRKSLILPAKKYSIAIGDAESAALNTDSVALASVLGKVEFKNYRNKTWEWQIMKVLPVSPHITLRSLAQAHARRDGRAAVSDKDLDFIRRFICYCDQQLPKVI